MYPRPAPRCRRGVLIEGPPPAASLLLVVVAKIRRHTVRLIPAADSPPPNPKPTSLHPPPSNSVEPSPCTLAAPSTPEQSVCFPATPPHSSPHPPSNAVCRLNHRMEVRTNFSYKGRSFYLFCLASGDSANFNCTGNHCMCYPLQLEADLNIYIAYTSPRTRAQTIAKCPICPQCGVQQDHHDWRCTFTTW